MTRFIGWGVQPAKLVLLNEAHNLASDTVSLRFQCLRVMVTPGTPLGFPSPGFQNYLNRLET